MKKRKLKLEFIIPITLICIIVILIASNKSIQEMLLTDEEEDSFVTRSYVEVADTTRYVEYISDSADVVKNIVYSETVDYNGKKIQLELDLYQPANDLEVNRPAIIWMHGGGLTNGNKDDNKFEQDLAIDFAKKGYVTIDINYRLRDKLTTNEESYAALMDGAIDAAQAFKWLQSNSETYGVDKNHIAFAGYSAGASIAINLCYSDITQYAIDPGSILGVVDLAGGNIYAGAVKKGYPACVIFHGTKDDNVPFNSSALFSANLSKHGVDNTFYQMENFTHDFTIGYDDISNKITMFLYKQLTNKDIICSDIPEKSYEYRKVEKRIATEPVYHAKQIELKIDGVLNEWTNSELITLNQIKDVGTSIPEQQDFSGTAMVGWNQQDPTRIYIAATITDDTIQDVNTAAAQWFNDDCVEMIFDLSKDNVASPLTKWVVGANGTDLSKLAKSDNTELKIVKSGTTYYYEMAIDLTKIEKDISEANTKLKLSTGTLIGFSIAYNDCEYNSREHQMGWTSGRSNDRASFGNVLFEE